MQITQVSAPTIADPAIYARINGDVTTAFQSIVTQNGQFIVNDTLWFAENDRHKVTPCVVNAAPYISLGFLRTLGANGWTLP